MKAAIDIGTNTVLLLIAEKDGDGLKVIHEEQRIPRLGKGVDKSRALSPDSVKRVIDVIKEYQALIKKKFKKVDEIRVTATSAVRDARNKKSFVNWVKTDTDLDVQILSGEEEAEMTYLGAKSALAVDDTKQDILVLDIGGGSTEIILGRDNGIRDSVSLDIGSVRFSERFLQHDPPFRDEILFCEEEIKSQLTKLKFKPKRKVQAIGVAGTMTALAAIDLQVDQFDAKKLNGHLVDRDKLINGIDIFSLHTHEQILELNPAVLKGREDIFLAGLLILKQFMLVFKLENILVSTGGVRHGILTQ